MQSFSMSCDASMIKGTPSEFHPWVLSLVTWIDGFSQPGILYAAQPWTNKK